MNFSQDSFGECPRQLTVSGRKCVCSEPNSQIPRTPRLLQPKDMANFKICLDSTAGNLCDHFLDDIWNKRLHIQEQFGSIV